VKIVIIGSCKYAPYDILITPNPLNEELYNKDHERAYDEACKVFYPKIDEADEVWIYAPDGLGEHTLKDYEYARKMNKKVRFIAGEQYMSECPNCQSRNIHKPRVKVRGTKFECLSCGETW